jgi:hypothetical protein
MSTYPKYDPNNQVVINITPHRRNKPKKWIIALVLALFSAGLGIGGYYIFAHRSVILETSTVNQPSQ